MKNIKGIITVLVAVVIIAVSAFFGYKMLFPSTNAVNKSQNPELSNDEYKYVNEDIDEETYEQIQKKLSYPKPAMDNIGKSDLFANY